MLTRAHVTQPDPGSSHRLARLVATSVALGLGPLVRPDFAVFSAGYLIALVVLAGGSWRRRLGLVAAAVALPALYQVFRMGYYAALVPNAALAKEATLARWNVGWDTPSTCSPPTGCCSHSWSVWPPASSLSPPPSGAGRGPTWCWSTFRSAPPWCTACTSCVSAATSLHGRLLLPAVFAFVMPFMVVTLTGSVRTAGLALTLAWAVSVTALRVPYEGIGPRGIADEREHYVAAAAEANPVTLEDYEAVSRFNDGMTARQWADEGRRVLAITTTARPGYQLVDLVPQLATTVAIEHANVGVVGAAAGSDVHVVDLHGLGDPVGARLRLERPGRPGHEKFLDQAWVLARYAGPGAPLPAGTSASRADAARRALGCGELRLLQEATHDRLTPGLFLANVAHSLRLHGFRVPNDPERAAQQLCGRAIDHRSPGAPS